MANEILQFCPTDTGTNLLSEAEYLAASDRTNGNQPGVASSKLVNKALRQSSFVATALTDLVATVAGTDVLDNGAVPRLLAQLQATMLRIAPVVTEYTSSTGTWVPTYYFMIASGSATVAATYTHNAVTYTVVATVASGTMIAMTGSGAPLASGTLTKSGGTGDTTLTFYAVRAPIALRVRLVGGGGGGASGGGSATNGGNGGSTTFGSSFLTAGGGDGGAVAGGSSAGGTATINSGATGIAVAGARGMQGSGSVSAMGGCGGNSAFGGAGAGGFGAGANGAAATTNSGSGGGGASPSGASGASGGAAGGFVDAMITAIAASYAYAVGAAGAAGTSGTVNGAAGGAGRIEVTQFFQ